MSGYIGNPDAESEHALILSENGIEASRKMLVGQIRTHCLECGDAINPKRIEALRALNMKCEYCIECQKFHDTPGTIKMLDRIL